MEKDKVTTNRCVNTDDWVCLHNGVLPTHLKNGIKAFTKNYKEHMEDIWLSKISQTLKKDKDHMLYRNQTLKIRIGRMALW